jgi:hypothetical protein
VRWGWEVADDFTIRGADDFLRLSKALKQAGRTELRKELHKGLKDGAQPLVPKAKAAAREKLPRRGGLAASVAKEPMRVQVRTGNTPGVRVVVGRRNGGAQAANRGVLRHPVFGRPGSFVNQSVPQARDWFDGTMRRHAPDVRPELEQAMTRVIRRVVDEAR